MVISTKNPVSSIYRYFRVPKEFNLKISSSKLPQLNPDGCPGWIALAVSKEFNPKFQGKDKEDEALVRQWVEYAVTHAVHVDDSANCSTILMELNKVLASRSYIATNYLTVADLLLFFILHSKIASLSYHDKELFQNVSRWFDHLQLDAAIRQSRECILFTRTLLYS